jgi:transposase-like protein
MEKAGRKNRKGGGRPNKASESHKKQIASVVLKDRLTLDDAAVRFGISRQTINRWVHQYYDDIEQTNVIEPMKDTDIVPIVPSERLQEYEDKLRQAQLKITALETMIELAENTYKIAIRKNSGTKQPK